MPELPEKDTVQLQLERDMLYRQLLSGSFMSTDLLQPFTVPQVDFNASLSERWNLDSFDFKQNLLQPEDIRLGFIGPLFTPFIREGTVLSSAAYQLNDRFKVGGYSFGANSIFTAPFPNQGFNNFDVHGSTLFMQYKVSKNFKIETRVNVTQGYGPGF
ncbi:MAG TPA: hypothetical protein VFD91_00310 [Mariniphaga sp.]|nr:hypothetical protein [Mariniphaga sp.]